MQVQIRHTGGGDVSLEDCARLTEPMSEALEAAQILNDAYKPILGEGMGMKGVSSEIYRDMIVNQLGDAIGKSGAFGIASSMHGQLVPEHTAKRVDEEK